MRRTSDESTNGAVPLNDTTDSPNGADSTTAVANPATPVDTIRIQPVVRRSQPNPDGSGAASEPKPPLGHRTRRIVTKATIGHEDRQLRLHQRRDDRKDRRPLAARLPQLPHRQQQEHRPEAVDLAPDHGVEPGDRVHDHDRAGDRRPAVADAEVTGHPVDDVAERDVGEDRRQLDQVADAAEELADDAHQPQRIQVARRVVGEEAAIVEAERPVVGEVGRPEPEQAEVRVEPGSPESGEAICHDQAEHQADRDDRQDPPADASPGGLVRHRFPAGRARTQTGHGEPPTQR